MESRWVSAAVGIVGGTGRQSGTVGMAKEEPIRVTGVVTEALPNATFRVEIEGGHKILAHVAGRMRLHFIRIIPGDEVELERSPYDLTRGRITYRGRRQEQESR